jgi:hypothetical protein
MPQRQRWYAAGIAVLLAFPAAAAPPLVLGVVHPGTRALLRPALSLHQGQWMGLDNKMAESARATGLPAFTESNKDTPATATPQQLAHALYAEPLDLTRWYGYTAAGQPLQRMAQVARQSKWSCVRSWGLVLDDAVADGDAPMLLSSQPVQQRRFEAWDASANTAGRWQLSDPAVQAAAVDLYLSTAASPAPDAASLKQRLAAAAAGAMYATQVRLADGTQIVALAQQLVADSAAELCANPVLIERAFFRIGKDGAAQRIAAQAEMQSCSEGWQPGPREVPWLWLEIAGQAWLLQWNYGVEAQRLGVYPVDPLTLAPAENALATGGESGC